MARRRKSRRRPEAPLDIRAAAEPDSLRICGEAADFELLAADRPAGDGKPALKKFSMTGYTGGAMNVGFGMPVVVDLQGMTVLRQANPILMSHDPSAIVAHTTAVDVSAQRVKVAGVMSGVGPAAQEVQALAANGFPWQASIGASIQQREYVDAGKTVQVNGRNFTGPLMVARKTVLGEVSFVPIGADQNTSATVTAKHTEGGPVNFEQWLKAAGLDPATLTDAAKAQLKAAYEAEVKAKANPVQAPAPGTPATPATPPVDFAAEVQKQIQAGREALAAETKRVGEIQVRCRRHGVTEVEIDGADGKKAKVALEAHAIQAGWTPDQAELHALRAARPVVPGGHVYSTTTPEVSEAVLEAALLQAAKHEFHLQDDSFYFDQVQGQAVRRVPERLQREAQGEIKARYTDQVQQAAHTAFRGRMGPQQLFRVAFRASGHHRELDFSGEMGVKAALTTWDHMERERVIRAEGSSNLSIANVLANVLNKFALQGYLFVEQAWREICAIRSVNDFKPSKSINLLGDVMFKQLGPSGELENASLGDQAFANQAQPFGRILTIPWTHLVNDDLGMLTGAPLKIGQGAGLALNDAIWTLWKQMAAGTTLGDDGTAFWRTSSSAVVGKVSGPNKITGGTSALSSTALKLAKALFDKQTDPNGNPLGFDGMMPTLLFPPSLWQVATELVRFSQLVYGGGSAALQPQGNVWAGTFKPVMSRYIENANYGNTATGWWILFNALALAVIEVAFLNGVDTPAVLQAGPDYQFDKLGISIRGTMPFGANAQNFRGGVFAVGT